MTHVLPALAPRVLVHHHDVLFPYDLYYKGRPDLNGEPDVVLEFYESNRATFEIVVGTAYVRHRNPDLVHRMVRSYRWQPTRVPGSVWSRRRGDP